MDYYPKCFDSLEQYMLWKNVARNAYPGASGICADCTPEYKEKMIKANRCARPLTYFIRIDGELVGKCKWRE